MREICRNLDEHMNSVRRELEHLERLQLIVSRVEDRKKYYRVNTDFVLFTELQSLFMKSQVVLQKKFLDAIAKIGSVKLLVLTGVFTGIPNTLTDVLIVGKINKTKLRKLLTILQKEVSTPLRYTLFSQREFQYRNDLTDRFIFHILESKRIIMIDRLDLSHKSEKTAPKKKEESEEKNDEKISAA